MESATTSPPHINYIESYKKTKCFFFFCALHIKGGGRYYTAIILVPPPYLFSLWHPKVFRIGSWMLKRTFLVVFFFLNFLQGVCVVRAKGI